MRRVREAQLVYAKLLMCEDSYRHGFLPCWRTFWPQYLKYVDTSLHIQVLLRFSYLADNSKAHEKLRHIAA